MIQHLLDIRKVSSGQQDINLFFTRILDPKNAEYRRSFNLEYTDFVRRALKRIEEKNKSKENQQKLSRVVELNDEGEIESLKKETSIQEGEDIIDTN